MLCSCLCVCMPFFHCVFLISLWSHLFVVLVTRQKKPCRLYVLMCLTFVDPWQCIYGRPGGHLFTKNAFAAVLHHQNSPEFYDEVRRTAKSHTRVILSVRVCDLWHFFRPTVQDRAADAAPREAPPPLHLVPRQLRQQQQGQHQEERPGGDSR